jgi:hypothetical protein
MLKLHNNVSHKRFQLNERQNNPNPRPCHTSSEAIFRGKPGIGISEISEV